MYLPAPPCSTSPPPPPLGADDDDDCRLLVVADGLGSDPLRDIGLEMALADGEDGTALTIPITGLVTSSPRLVYAGAMDGERPRSTW